MQGLWEQAQCDGLIGRGPSEISHCASRVGTHNFKNIIVENRHHISYHLHLCGSGFILYIFKYT